MTVPAVAVMRLPLLQLLSDGQPHHVDEYTSILADLFSLTPDELEIRNKHGRLHFRNLVQWARLGLRAAGLVEATGRNYLAITTLGQLVLRQRVDLVDSKVLARLKRERALPKSSLPVVEKDLDQDFYAEGLRRVREAQFFQRNSDLARDARRLYGYACQACGFDFERYYGCIGKGYIECHHINPLSERDEQEWTAEVRTQLQDVVVLCANCHAVVHRCTPAYTLQELTGLLQTTNLGTREE